MKNIRLKIPYHYREIVKNAKCFHSVMTSMIMFTQNQNPSNFARI